MKENWENEAIIVSSGVSSVAAESKSPTPLDVSVKIESVSPTPLDVSVKIESLEAEPNETNDPKRVFEPTIRTSNGSAMGQSQLRVKLTRLPTHLLNTYIKKAKNICSDTSTGSPPDNELILKKTSNIHQTVKTTPPDTNSSILNDTDVIADNYNTRKNTKANIEHRSKNNESKSDISTKKSNDVAIPKYNRANKENTNYDLLSPLDTHACTTCKYKTNNTRHYIHHLEAHSAATKYICDTCSYIGIDKQRIICHLKTHTRKMPYSCDICNEKFGRRIHLTNHIIEHTNENIVANIEKENDANKDLRQPSATHSCIMFMCKYKTNNSRTYKYHLEAHSAPKKFICDTCSYIATDKHGIIKEKPYECQICDKNFSKKAYVRDHIKIHTGEKHYQCQICDKKFTQKSHVKAHIRIHTGEKPHTCTICNRKFGRRNILTNHMRTHTNEKSFTCKICDKMFSENISLKNHLLIHTELKAYTCDICDKTFIDSNKLKRHFRIHTREKPYACKECDKKFTRNDHLTKHAKKIHSEEKPYACNVCDHKFRRHYMLTLHNRTHTTEFTLKKPYFCKVCDKKFTKLGFFKNHIRLIHTAKPSCK